MNKLQALRMQRGISQKRLAEMMGIDASILCRCERGWLAKPPPGLEERLQTFFGNEWTFERLMESVPGITANDSDAA